MTQKKKFLIPRFDWTDETSDELVVLIEPTDLTEARFVAAVEMEAYDYDTKDAIVIYRTWLAAVAQILDIEQTAEVFGIGNDSLECTLVGWLGAVELHRSLPTNLNQGCSSWVAADLVFEMLEFRIPHSLRKTMQYYRCMTDWAYIDWKKMKVSHHCHTCLAQTACWNQTCWRTKSAASTFRCYPDIHS